MLDIEWPFSIHMDFRGQKKAERLFQIIISIAGIIGFITGYILQQFSAAVYIVLFGVLISALLTLPPWPMYRNDPVEWQKDSTTSNKNSTSSKTSKKDNQKPKTKKDQ